MYDEDLAMLDTLLRRQGPTVYNAAHRAAMGLRVRELREERGMTLDGLVRAVNEAGAATSPALAGMLTVTDLSRLEHGLCGDDERGADALTVSLIARALDVPTARLIAPFMDLAESERAQLGRRPAHEVAETMWRLDHYGERGAPAPA